jgi:hypothetical protein
LLAIPLVAFVIACGGGGDDDDSSSASNTGGGAATGSQATGGGNASGSTGSQATGGGGGGGGGSATGSQATGATGPAATGSSDDSDDIDLEDCPQLEAFVNSAGVGEAFTGDGVLGTDFNPEDFQQLAENAPGEIRADMQVLADVLTEFFTAFEELEVDFSNPASFANLTAEELAELDELSTKFDTPEVTAATERVEAYFEEICS